MLAGAEKLLDKDLLRPDEVQQLARVSRATVYRLVARGDLGGTRAFGPLRIFAASVREIIGEGKTE